MLADQLRGLVAEDPRRGRVHGFDRPRLVDGDEPAQHVVQDGACALLALAQRPLRRPPLGDVAYHGHEALRARGGRDGHVHGHRVAVRAPDLRLDVAGGRGGDARDQLADVAADEVGQAPAEQPLSGRVRGADLPARVEGHDGVGHGVHDRPHALLAGAQRAGHALRPLDGAAARGGQRPDQAEQGQAGGQAAAQDQRARPAALAALEAGQGGQVQHPRPAGRDDRAPVGQQAARRIQRAHGRHAVVDERVSARRRPVVDLQVEVGEQARGQRAQEVARARGGEDPAAEAAPPLLHRGRSGRLGVVGREEQEPRRVLGILDQLQPRRHHRPAAVARRFGGRAPPRLRGHVHAEGGGMGGHRLDVGDGEVLGPRPRGPDRRVDALGAQPGLENRHLGVREARDVAEGTDAGIARLDPERIDVAPPVVAVDVRAGGEERGPAVQDLLVGGEPLAEDGRDLVRGPREALLPLPLEAVLGEVRAPQGEGERRHQRGQGQPSRASRPPGGRGGGGQVRRRFQRRAQGGLRALALAHGPPEVGHRAPELDLRRGLLAEVAQGRPLLGRELPRGVVDDAQRADGVAVGGAQRGARVEADVRVAKHQRVVGEARVRPGVGHDQQVQLQDGVRAERLLARQLRGLQPDLRLEPLPVLVEEAHQRDGRPADRGRDAGQGVEVPLRRRVQDVRRADRLQPLLLVLGPRCGPHPVSRDASGAACAGRRT